MSLARWPLLNTRAGPARHWRRLAVDADLLVDLGKARDWLTVWVSDHPLPDDARCVSVLADPTTNQAVLALESASYPPVPEGAPIPWVEPPSFVRWWGPGRPPEPRP